jgi:hypothetical protein
MEDSVSQAIGFTAMVSDLYEHCIEKHGDPSLRDPTATGIGHLSAQTMERLRDALEALFAAAKEAKGQRAPARADALATTKELVEHIAAEKPTLYRKGSSEARSKAEEELYNAVADAPGNNKTAAAMLSLFAAREAFAETPLDQDVLDIADDILGDLQMKLLAAGIGQHYTGPTL